ncbi:major facilitator protein [Kwoniella heveanensis CBS 569]|nr:major facilitator protein [Kwoniella heveanensis CBS 569]
MFSTLARAGLVLAASASICLQASAFRVPIRDTDSLREVCSGMYGGKDAHIEVAFDPSSSGQVALIIYEWRDVPYLGVASQDGPRTYICTTSAVRSGLCLSSELGSFITSLPEGVTADSTSIYTTPLKFSSEGFSSIPDPTPVQEEESGEDESDEFPTSTSSEFTPVETGSSEVGVDEDETEEETQDEAEAMAEAMSDGLKRKRQIGDDIASGIADGVGSVGSQDEELGGDQEETPDASTDTGDDTGFGSDGDGTVPTYNGPITYPVPKTGYYCVGIVPVTLVNSRSEMPIAERQEATHAEYSGLVLFKNTFEGELPAVEYPKINFYFGLSLVYLILGAGWAYLCVKHLRELLPMQYYISGTIVFLLIEMLAQFAYYRYINKHGGGTTSIVFLFVIAVLNAARNSLSFFLLLIVSMGLSVVTQSLGSVMNRVRILTGLHFVFGVMYAVGTVEVELDSASLITVLLLIFPLALTLTAFLMWIIVSLNGTILHLQARKQRYKLQMFQRLWRILIISVIAVAAFFVVSSMSLSNRLDEDYAPNNWKYRWILLDGSLATIYLCAFAAIAWLWRPTRDNLRFSMSQELAQDEADADAEDYEIDSLEAGRGLGESGHRPLGQHDDEEEGLVGRSDGNVVFAMGEDSDDEDGPSHRNKGGYRDDDDGHKSDEDDRKGKND